MLNPVAKWLACFVVLVLCPACALAIVFRNSARRRASQKTIDQETPVNRLVKILLMVAADTGDRASKIVFGEPCEPDCARIPYDRLPPCPWEEENQARFLGKDLEVIQKEQSGERAAESRFPVFFKIGNTYQEQASLPGQLCFPIFQIIEQWNGKKVLWNSATPRCPTAEENNILLRDPGKPVLSRFLMEFENGNMILVRFGFEPSYCFSMEIDYPRARNSVAPVVKC